MAPSSTPDRSGHCATPAADEAAFWWAWCRREGGLARDTGSLRPPPGPIGAWYRDHPEAWDDAAILGWLVRHPAAAPAWRAHGLPVAETGLPPEVRTSPLVIARARLVAQYPVRLCASALHVAAGPGRLDPLWTELAAGRQVLRWAATPAELQAQDRIFRRLG